MLRKLTSSPVGWSRLFKNGRKENFESLSSSFKLFSSKKSSKKMVGTYGTEHPVKQEPCTNQLMNYAQGEKSDNSKVFQATGTELFVTKPALLTTTGGAPVGERQNALTAGPRGPMLLQDVVYFDEITQFDRERIPERVVHAKGGGAHGYFEVTNDITKYTKACVFSEIGKKTPLFIRFSTVIGEQGSADTARDPRGFAIKMYTEQGNWDLVANNTPIFFVRDPMQFHQFIHSQKRNPVTHLKDINMYWDFLTLRPESIHQVMYMFGDRGTPDGFRHMNGYGSHTFKMVNNQGEPIWCKFHIKTDQGIRNLPADRAMELVGKDPDYAVRDLYNAIELGNFPSWSFFIQVMSMEQADRFKFNPFDLTKIWPHDEHPLIPVGKIVLDRNPANYFAEVEQAAFSPARMIPGIEPSPDKMLQGRLISYIDTHYHRLGKNYQQIPINCPYRTKVANYAREGAFAIHHQDGAPTYHPNSFRGPEDDRKYSEHRFAIQGDAARYNSNDEEDNFTQPAVFWRKVLDEGGRQRLVDNIGGHLKDAASFIRERAVKVFAQVDPDFGRRVQESLDEYQKRDLCAKAT